MKKMLVVILMMVALVNSAKAERWTDDEGQVWITNVIDYEYEDFVEMQTDGVRYDTIGEEITAGFELAEAYEKEGIKLEVTFKDRVVDWDGFRVYLLDVFVRSTAKSLLKEVEYITWVNDGMPSVEK